MVVRPAPGVSCQHLRLDAYWDLGTFAVGGEVLHIKDILNSDGPEWRLIVESRGCDDTPVPPHTTGTAVTGLMNAYRKNYVPDTHNDLIGILADRYSSLVNEALLDHQHYDGAEIHRGLSPWGFSHFNSLVAARVDHPTTSSTSGGRMADWSFEQRFSRIAALDEIGYWDVHLPVLLAGQRNASSWLDAHFEANSKIISGARRVSLGKPEPMFGLTCEAMTNHGLLPRLQGLFKAWGKLLPHLDTEDLEYLRTYMKPVSTPLRQGGGHSQSQDVLVLEERDGKSVLVPTRILTREGVDSPWRVGQEFGAIGPRQYVQIGETLNLPNPNPAQVPGLILHVLPAVTGSSAKIAEDPSAKTSAAASQEADYRTGTHAPSALADATASHGTIQDGWRPNGTKKAGLTSISVTDDGLVILGENPTSKPYWTENDLPGWPVKIPMGGNRAVQITVDGDGSGALLVLQLDSGGTRDWILHIDFTGRRTFTIPNGEAAWADATWGWRMGANHFDYQGTARAARLGFGYLPAKTTATITVHSLAVPATQAAPLVDPVIHVGTGTLAIRGEVGCDEYLTYEGGQTVQVFDRNWKPLRTLPAKATDLIAGADVPFRVTHEGQGPQPWLEVQVITRGEPHVMTTKPCANAPGGMPCRPEPDSP